MINYIWGLFIVIGIVYGFITGNISSINNTILESTKSSIDIIISLIPIMCLWTGIISIVIDSGLINVISKYMGRVISKLFCDIPLEDESLGLISTNMSMNMLGVGNAGTSIGLKTMKSLQRINKNKDIASDSMITFVLINCASITLIPTTIISLRYMHGSNNPSEIIIPCIIVSFITLLFTLVMDKIFRMIWRWK